MRIGQRHISAQELDALDDQVFASLLREFLAENYPEEWRKPILLRLRGQDERRWLNLLNQHGLRAPGLPREYGGMGLSLQKQLVYKAEFDGYGVARVLDIGATLLAPVLIRYGTAEQQAKHLPRILACDDMWCQGFSEPGAGSDLAGLRTAATQEGGDFVINGQKIWTSHASTASHIFLLARTGKYEKRQQGISFILADIASPGIVVRPIVNLAGDDEFCEVFFDNVRVPVGNLVGRLDDGWTVAKSLLGTERLLNGSPTLAQQTFDYLVRMLASAPDMRRAASADDRMARLGCDLHDADALYEEVCDAAVRGVARDSDYSILKILSTELFQRASELLLDLANERGASAGAVSFGDWELDIHRLAMIARPGSIYGGTNEIQRDILARSIFSGAVG